MQVFGYLCSAFCKGKAESQGMDLPVYAGQRHVAQSEEWRKVRVVTFSALGVIAVVLGVWGWYAWIASVPKVSFALRMPNVGYNGQVRVCPQNQVVFLHGGTLARHDMKAKKEIWSNELIDRKALNDEATKQFQDQQTYREQFRASGGNLADLTFVTREEYLESLERSAMASLRLFVRGENIWVSSPGKLTRYDWQTGKPGTDVALNEDWDERPAEGDELQFVSYEPSGGQSLIRVNLASGESKTEELIPAPALAGAPGKPGKGAATNQLAAGKSPKPIDPAAIAARAPNMSKPARLALPAVIAAGANQQRLEAAMRDQDDLDEAAARALRAGLRPFDPDAPKVFITANGVVQLSSRLLETKIVQRKAMRDPPKKSALDGPINQAATAAIANELLNEMTRERGGDVVEEDVSRYQVTLRRGTGKDATEWTGEVTGSPDFFALQTVDVVTGGKTAIVLDRAMKKLWEAQFNYGLPGPSERGPEGELPTAGDGPCVERGDTLYIYDGGVLTAFELATGNVRWRLPSVGTTGLRFDDQGMIYVNTTTATPDNLKYSNEVDIEQKISPVALKVDPKTGKTLWRANNDGVVCYISGKLIYTVESHPGDDDESDGLLGVETMFHIPPHVRIRRLDAKNGRVLWQHYQKRFPLDVRYDKNSIHLLFKREVQVLKFIML
jgi:hypothetical protein